LTGENLAFVLDQRRDYLQEVTPLKASVGPSVWRSLAEMTILGFAFLRILIYGFLLASGAF